MGKASSTKKVARAARTGRARSRRRSGSSLVWPLSLTVIVIVGVLLVIVSRSEESKAATEPPRLGDHWHAAIGYYDCGQWLGNQGEFENAQGMHTHGDGLIHLHPTSSEVTGKRATLGKWFDLSGVKFDGTSFQVPGVPAKKNGDKCGSKRGRVQVQVNGKPVKGDPRNVKLKQNMVIAVAFVAPGTAIPQPPSVAQLANPVDAPGGTTLPPNSVPPTSEVTGTTAAPGTTTATPDTTTAAPATTAAP